MIRIRYTRDSETDSPEVWLDEATRAVRAELYAGVDEGQGGVTFGDLKKEDIGTLVGFDPGAKVIIESHESDDVLDDTDPTTERDTRIWWRATIGADP
jgi:hypothetical protein